MLLAVEGGEPVGFAAVATTFDPQNLLEPVGEIEVLHVVPRWGRRGHGGRLLVSAAAELRRLGARSGRRWIPQADTATTRFLTAAGWAEDGVRRELDTGGAPIVELRWSGLLDLVADLTPDVRRHGSRGTTADRGSAVTSRPAQRGRHRTQVNPGRSRPQHQPET